MGTRKKDAVCAYCGVRIADTGMPGTREHALPRSLFPEYPGYQPRLSFITVPACNACNGGKSDDDEYLRNVLTLRLSALRHPDIGHLLHKFVKSGIEGSKLPLRMIDSGRMARHPATGMFIPSLVEIPLDDKRLARILKNIARALYFHEHKRVLNKEYQYRIFELPDTAINGWINFFPEAGLRPYREIGDGQVEYQHGRFTHDLDTTIWTLCFFGGVWYGGLTLPPSVSSRAEIAGHLFPHLLADDALVSTDDEAS